MRLYVATLALSLACSGIADRADDIVNAEMKAQKIPGATIVILRDGKPVKIKGYGFSNLELGVPASPSTIYQSGSIGKQFTATLVLMLAHDHVFNLDDPISKWLTEGGDAWKGVTIRHLLSHTSGLPDAPYGKMDMRKDYTEADLAKLIASTPPPKAPGTEWRYNNGGYVLLGVLIHRATGKFYGDLLKEMIFGPLGMKTARVIDDSDIIPNRAAGYVLLNIGLVNQSWVSPSLNTTADGALYLSAIDYAKWDAALYGSKLLPFTELEQAWTPSKLADGKVAGGIGFAYGFGWMIPSLVGGHHLVEHGGAWQGFTTYIGRCLDAKTTVVVLTNLDAGHSHPTKIGRKLLGLYVKGIPVPK